MPTNKKIKLSSTKDQYLIDAGQKKFGATQCSECGIIYQIGDAVDENDHMTYHSASDILKFPVTYCWLIKHKFLALLLTFGRFSF